MITVKITGKGTGTISGSAYTVSVPVGAFDYSKSNEEWAIAQTILTVTGPITDSAATVKNNLVAAAAAWKTSLAASDTFSAKLANLEGTTL